MEFLSLTPERDILIGPVLFPPLTLGSIPCIIGKHLGWHLVRPARWVGGGDLSSCTIHDHLGDQSCVWGSLLGEEAVALQPY